MEDDRDLIPVASFETEVEAHLLRTALNDRGIPAKVSGDVATSSAFAGLLGGSGLIGCKVFVRRLEYDMAMKIIAELPQESQQLAPAWTCSCGEQVDEGFGVCWSCGGEHPDAEPPL